MLTAATGLNQVSYIIDSLDDTIAWWVRVTRVGSFLRLDNIAFDEADYLGSPARMSFSAAMAYSG